MISFVTVKPKLPIQIITPSLMSNALPVGLLQRLHYTTNQTNPKVQTNYDSLCYQESGHISDIRVRCQK